MSLQEYWKRVNELPTELSTLVQENWDYTGRPITINPKNNIVRALLQKNAKAGGESFLKDMSIIFPDVYREEAAIYYNAFIDGAKYLADNMSKKD